MAAGDLCDLALAKVAANFNAAQPATAATDEILGQLITAISAYVPQVINRNILADNYSELYAGNGKDRLLLRQRPVILVSAVQYGSTVLATPGSMARNGLWSDGRNARLTGGIFPRGTDVLITYSAGYVDVPADVALAVAELVAEAYKRLPHVGETSRSQGAQITTSFETKAMHNAIADKLRNYRHGAPC